MSSSSASSVSVFGIFLGKARHKKKFDTKVFGKKIKPAFKSLFYHGNKAAEGVKKAPF